MTQTGELGEVYRFPLYTQSEAARILSVPDGTLRNWARGYSYKTFAGVRGAAPLITTTERHSRGGPIVPFVGLAEAFVLSAFRAAGVPMQRIRPALEWLDEHIGLPAALASNRLKTDGAEILYDFSRFDATDPETAHAVEDLVVVRNQQRVFVDVVRDYLAHVEYDGRWISLIHLPKYESLDVVVNPEVNFGKPTVASRGIRVKDILDRLAAGETPLDVATDYDLRINDVQELYRLAA